MKKACGIQLVLYLAIAIAVWTIVYRRYPDGTTATMAAIFGGVVVWMGIAYLWVVPRKIAEARINRRARDGQRPVDGEKVAAIGRITANRGSLRSPITSSPAVVYKYEIEVQGKESTDKVYSGFALVPSTIQTPSGPIRLLAYPDLKVKKTRLSTREARESAEAYIRDATFRESGARSLREAFAEVMAVYKDDDGEIRFDQRYRHAESADLARATFKEWVIRPGEQVCAIGRYSAQRGGLVYDPDNPLEQVTIEVGEPDTFAGRSLRSAFRYLVAGIVIIAISLAALVVFAAKVPLDPELDVTEVERRFERFIERTVRPALREAGLL
ncbi:MAG TPA: hypothetical protein VFT12_12555 [Thermoanaerobaculia bacterium]|nr:hypothetical protein [Thermoanaerobaculia bacterium]